MSTNNTVTSFNPDRLREMITAGKTARDITTEFGLSPHTLMDQLVMLQELDRKVYIVLGLFDLSEKEKVACRKEGILFHKEILEKIGFEPGDAFEMKASGKRIIIEKTTDS